MKKSTTQILIVILISIITVSCKENKEVSQAEETAVEKEIVRNIEPVIVNSTSTSNPDLACSPLKESNPKYFNNEAFKSV